ncbi:hypothetical protein [Streptomyces sp. NPDC051211]|uniref:hypothetical protein n=1 Tax=Streptomyces sp. NPDC051211 TaxID=3154643 RepID=UPI0034503B5F
MRELWRYNWHVYTTDRLELMSLMHAPADSVLLILRDDRYDGVVPGSVRLADLKGSANPEQRGPEHLRSVLDPPNQIINFVHVADEPADVVRETGILLDRPGRRRLLREVASGRPEEAAARAATEIAEVEAACPASDFDLEEALTRLKAQAAGPADGAGVDRLRAAIASGAPLTWDELTGIVDPADPGTDFWDFVRIATSVLAAERPAGPDLLPPSSAAAWREHLG